MIDPALCIYCGVYVNVDDPPHDDDCPFSTGLWPSPPEDAVCMVCGSPFTGSYMLRPHGETFDMICVGCTALMCCPASFDAMVGELDICPLPGKEEDAPST